MISVISEDIVFMDLNQSTLIKNILLLLRLQKFFPEKIIAFLSYSFDAIMGHPVYSPLSGGKDLSTLLVLSVEYSRIDCRVK